MQPDFGTRIFDSLFEPSTSDLEIALEDTLNEDIATWLPYIIIDAIDVDRHIDAHTIEITLSIRVTEQGANTQIKLLIDSDGIQVNELVL